MCIRDRMGLDGTVLAETVKNYNGYCETGVDEEFGKDAKYLSLIHI